MASVQVANNERSDIVRPDRLQGFSDAVIATAATLLVIPVRKFELIGDETLKEALIRRLPEFIVFVLGFLVICAVWESHIMRFKLMKRVDDVIVALTLLSLMITTFLPFTVALEGHYGKHSISIICNCLMLLLMELIELLIYIYAFRNPKLLSDEFRMLTPTETKIRKKQIYAKVLINCLLFITSASLSLASWIASGILVCVVIITPLLRRLIVRGSNWCCRSDSDSSAFNILTGRISKERIEYFSDAAIAIVATLLILDLTTEDFPKKDEIEKIGLERKLADMWQMFVGYMGTFATVGFLWFVHHSVLHQIKIFTPLMVISNNIFLAFLAGTPFISTLSNKYTGHASENEQIAVRVSCFVIFMASLMHVVTFVLALWNRNCALYSWAIPNSELVDRSTTHMYLLLKTLIIPVVTLITFLSSLFTAYGTFVIYHTALFVTPLIFIMLKIAYACHCWQHHPSDMRSIGSTDISDMSDTDERSSYYIHEHNQLLPRRNRRNYGASDVNQEPKD